MWLKEFDRLLFSKINDDESTIQAALLKKEYMPNVLYKYRKVTDRNLEALCNNFLIAAAPSTLNDPDEGAMFIDYGNRWKIIYEVFLDLFKKNTGYKIAVKPNDFNDRDSLIVELARCMGIRPEEFQSWDMLWQLTDKIVQLRLERFQNELKKINNDLHRICSLSSICDSNPMWVHYADDYKGYCVGYDIKTLNNDLTDLLFPVRYVDEMLEVDDTFFGCGEINKSFLMDSLTRKSTQWSHEKEWRLLLLAEGESLHKKVELPRPVNIIIGKNITKQDQMRILEIATSLKVPCYKQNIRENSYGHDFIELV